MDIEVKDPETNGALKQLIATPGRLQYVTILSILR
jgi:hypothetical protein